METPTTRMRQVYNKFLDRFNIFTNTYKNKKIIVYSLIVINLTITLTLAEIINIWLDEAYSLHTTSKDIIYTIKQSLYFELQPPLYFVLLNIWRSLNGSIFWSRLFSVVCIAITIYVVACVSQKFLKEIHPGWVVTAVALNPFVIWAALEIRLYALLLLLSALLLLAFFNAYLTEVPITKARWFYVLLSVLALYTQYYSGFLLVANGFVLLILRRWKALHNYFFDMVVVGICFAPMLLFIGNQVSEHVPTVERSSSFLNGLKFISQRISWYILEKKWIPLPETQKSILLFLCLIGLVFIVIKNRRSITVNYIAIWSITVILGILFILLKDKLGEELVERRHTTILFIPSILSLFSVFSLVKEKSRKKYLLILIMILVFSHSISLYLNYKTLAKTGDWKQVASYIMATEKPSQAILVFPASNALPLSYYYSGLNPLVPIPKAENFQKYDLHTQVLNDEKEIFTALSLVPGKHESLWLINSDSCKFMNVDYKCENLEKFVSKHYTIQTSKDFFDTRVRLIQRKPNY